MQRFARIHHPFALPNHPDRLRGDVSASDDECCSQASKGAIEVVQGGDEQPRTRGRACKQPFLEDEQRHDSICFTRRACERWIVVHAEIAGEQDDGAVQRAVSLARARPLRVGIGCV